MISLKYHKIQSVFKRDDSGNFILGDWSTREIEFLSKQQWVGTEKIDGTNIRIALSPTEPIEVGGRKDNSQIPTFLMKRLEELFPLFSTDKIFRGKIFNDEAKVILVGEGFGKKIQKVGSMYIPDGTDFILFDVNINGWWLTRENVDIVANKIGIKSVPVIFKGTLLEAIELIKHDPPKSIFSEELTGEGMVLVPAVELRSRSGERIITKVKVKDFAKKGV